MSDLRTRIVSRSFLKRERVDALGEVIGVRQLGIAATREFRAEAMAAMDESAPGAPADKENELYVLATFWGAVDPESGERLFTTAEHRSFLLDQPSEALYPIAETFLRINGLKADPQAVATAEGNSSATPTSDGG